MCMCLLTSAVSVSLVAFSVFIYPVHPRCKNMALSQFYPMWSHKGADWVTEILCGIGNFCLLIHALCCCFSASPLEWINSLAPGEEEIKEPIIREETLCFWENAESSSSPKWVWNGLFFFILQMKPNPFCFFCISSIAGWGWGAGKRESRNWDKIVNEKRVVQGMVQAGAWIK